jgi:hypothetical protein
MKDEWKELTDWCTARSRLAGLGNAKNFEPQFPQARPMFQHPVPTQWYRVHSLTIHRGAVLTSGI